MTIKRPKTKQVIFLSVFLVSGFSSVYIFPNFFTEYYTFEQTASVQENQENTKEETVVFRPTYVATPEEVKGIYMTSWTASAPKFRDPLVKIIDETEINTVVIDVKDYSGKIVFPIENPELKAFGSEEVRVSDMKDFIEDLHKKGVYVIARLAVFQDEYFVKYRPDLAVKNLDGTAVWKDRKGISWIDSGSKEYWDYIILLSKEVHKIGFDEINFDYIRFPSDGNMKDISFPFSSTTPKHLVMKEFFKYLDDNLNEPNLKISADLFGMVTTVKSDMGIGQLLEDALPHFDYIMPMVYPSHYPKNWEGFSNPADYPYDVVRIAMKSAVDRAVAMNPTYTETEILNGTTTQVTKIKDLNYKVKLRPWIQDFNLGATYDATKVRAQIQATYDVGLNSWIIWSPSNRYTRGALESE